MEAQGFVLSEAALYAFKCQDVYPDIVSFAAAIPDNLKQLFLIPVAFQQITASDSIMRIADGIQPSGDTPEGELFSYRSFNYEDNQGTIPNSSPGSIFDVDGADSLTHHQDYNWDENIQVPTDTSYLSDIDTTQFWDYPYRTKEKPVRKSSENLKVPVIVRLALQPEEIKTHVPKNIIKNSEACSVNLVSYNKKIRVFTFAVNSGNGIRTVKAGFLTPDNVALSCNCKFWRWNGPEFHAKSNSFMLGQPYGSASIPKVRDPENRFWLCKHSYAVLLRLNEFIKFIISENWGFSEDEIMGRIDKEWDRVESISKTPVEEIEKKEVKVDVISDKYVEKAAKSIGESVEHVREFLEEMAKKKPDLKIDSYRDIIDLCDEYPDEFDRIIGNA